MVHALRLGIGGTPGTYQIKDTEGASVLLVTMKYPGSRRFSLTIRPTLENPDESELLILDGTTALERFAFDSSEGVNQQASLVASVADATSNYINLSVTIESENALATVDQVPIAPGTDPFDAGGTPGTYDIKDSAGRAVIRITAVQDGFILYTVTIRPTEEADVSELVIGLFSSAAGINQVTALMEASTSSVYVILSKLSDSTNALAEANAQNFTPGTKPTGYSVAAYSAAFEALETLRWNVLSIDTVDTSVQTMMQMFLNRIYESGQFTMGVIGEDKVIPFETRLRHASAYNDYQIVYVGTGYTDISGNVYTGYLAAARIAGLIAGTPSNESITHLPITGAVELTEPLTNYYLEQAILAGMLTFSTSSADTVWVEYGINSLVMTGTKEDAGWKKIKRVKIRFELMQRLNDTVEGLVGRVNNDPDGRMTIIQSANAVCNAMVTERKLLPGAHCEIDVDNAPAGDSAWFLVYADDIDALEKMYFAFKFRFAPEEA